MGKIIMQQLEVEHHQGFGRPHCFVFKMNGSVIGHALVTHFGRKLAILWNVYVVPEARKRGLGQVFIRYLQGNFGKRISISEHEKAFKGFDIINTEYDASTKQGRRLLIKCGFKKQEKLLTWVRSPEALLLMEQEQSEQSSTTEKEQ